MDKLTGMGVFTRVVDSGSFVSAAEQLGLSRAMASKHVMALEDHLGVRLLNRTTRRLSLTEAGQSFYARCRDVLSQVEEAEREAADLHIEPRGVLRLNTPMVFGNRHVAPAIADYLSAHPDLRIDMTLNDHRVDLIDEGYDLAIRIGQLADSSLIARKLAPCRMVVCATPAYFAAKGVPQKPADLAGHNCPGYAYSSEGNEWRFEGPDGKESVKVSGNFTANNGDTLRAFVLGGGGVDLQPTFIIGADLAAGRLQAVLMDYQATELGVYAVYPQNRYVSAKVRSFIDFLAARFGSTPYWDAWQSG